MRKYTCLHVHNRRRNGTTGNGKTGTWTPQDKQHFVVQPLRAWERLTHIPIHYHGWLFVLLSRIALFCIFLCHHYTPCTTRPYMEGNPAYVDLVLRGLVLSSSKLIQCAFFQTCSSSFCQWDFPRVRDTRLLVQPVDGYLFNLFVNAINMCSI